MKSSQVEVSQAKFLSLIYKPKKLILIVDLSEGVILYSFAIFSVCPVVDT